MSTIAGVSGVGVQPQVEAGANSSVSRVNSTTSQDLSARSVAQSGLGATTTTSSGFGAPRLLDQLFSLMGFGADRTVVITPPDRKGPPTNVIVGGAPPKDTPKNTTTTLTSLVPPKAQIFKTTGDMEWRPSGRNNFAEMVFRPEHKGQIATVELLSEDGTRVVARPTSAGTDSKDRPVWRFAKTGTEFPKGAILMMTMKDGRVRYLEIPNPAKTFKH